jgi:uncharacterized membrane protein YphA (DoxX/SURF4 family)
MSVAGVVFLALGSIAARKDIAAAHGLNKLAALAFVFYAAPLAVFGAEHLTDAREIMQLVPVWIPARLFWAYFVGVALITASLSLSLKRHLRLTGSLVALMFFLFVVMMHIPGVVEHPRDRFFWAIVFRDSSFGAGALALAGAMTPGLSAGRGNLAVTVARVILGVALIVYGVEHLLHPAFAPGVPLEKLTPAWVPLPHLWSYLAGTVEVVTGVAILINRYTRDAAVIAGLLMVLLTLLLYVPILAMARSAADIVVGLNYVFDTLLYGGTVLLLAFASPMDRSADNVKALFGVKLEKGR